MSLWDSLREQAAQKVEALETQPKTQLFIEHGPHRAIRKSVSNPNPRRKVKNNGKSRLNLRLPDELDRWARQYIKDNDLTMTALIVGFLKDLKEKVEGGHVDQF